MTAASLTYLLAILYVAFSIMARFGVVGATFFSALCGVMVVWIAPSLSGAYYISQRLKKRLSTSEYTVVAVILAILVLPILLAVEFLMLGRLWPSLPLINALCITALTYWRQPLSLSWPKHISFPLWALGVHAVVTLAITLAYLALPDIDPYKWANWYAMWFGETSSEPLPSRPLFYFFVYLFVPGSSLPLYAFFKYVFPFIACLSIIPATLTLPRAGSRWAQATWLLLPLLSPSLILYAGLPIPQSLLLICVFLFFHLVLYAKTPERFGWYATAGLIIAAAFFYHQAAAVIFLLWILATLWWKQQEIAALFRRRPVVTVGALTAMGSVGYFAGMHGFLMHWLSRITSMLRYNPNWHFPAYYINIDGQSVGWTGVAGVLKYYLFYVGPPLLGILIVTGILTIASGRVQKALRKSLYPPSHVTVIILAAAFFFMLSEILPRLSSIALLPERAWLFGAIFSSALLWKLISLFPRANAAYGIFLVFIASSVGGALYVNAQKAHTIPDYQVRAAEWIKKNLPGDRLIASNEQPYLLTTNAESAILPIDGISLCNLDLAKPEFLRAAWLRLHPQENTERQKIAEVYWGRLQNLIAIDPDITLADLDTTSEHFINKLNENARQHHSIPPLQHRVFIYHAVPDSRDMLRERPYTKANEEAVCLTPVFDEHPELFTKIYDDRGLVRIWRFTDPTF